MEPTVHRRILQAIFILGLLGVLLAIFLTITHYTGTPSEACPVHRSGIPTCDIVNQSIYAEIFGIPIALIAVFVYSAYSAIAYLLLSGKQVAVIRASPFHLRWGLVLLSGTSLLFAFYLVYLLYAVLQTVCIYCIIAHTLTLTIFILSLTILFGAKKRK